jgi:Uma2 family endonuclease
MTTATASISLCSPAMRAWSQLREGTLAEVINNKLFVLGSPSPYHQRISRRLLCALDAHIMAHDLGEVFDAPIDVHLCEGVVVIPDIVFIAKANPIIIAHNGLHGSPDVHIEVLSRGNKEHDLITKKKLYEKAGVKEYWIIDQSTKKSYGYLLENNQYHEPLIMTSKVHIRILDKEISF